MSATRLRPGDLVQYASLPERGWVPGPGQWPADAPRQRYVVMAVLRMGVRLQAVNGAGRPTGEVLLLGYEHLDATVCADAGTRTG